MYFLISCNDGDPRISIFTREKLMDEINSERWKDIKFISLSKLEKDPDPNYWEENVLLIIKGEVVVPENEQVIIRRTLK